MMGVNGNNGEFNMKGMGWGSGAGQSGAAETSNRQVPNIWGGRINPASAQV